MSHDDRDQPVKRKRATQECDPPGITGRVCDGLSWRRSDPSASNPRPQFGAFSHASKNSCIGVRRTLACGSEPELRFTLNHYTTKLFKLVNFVATKMISEPKEIKEIYDGLPKKKRDAIDQRDGRSKQ